MITTNELRVVLKGEPFATAAIPLVILIVFTVALYTFIFKVQGAHASDYSRFFGDPLFWFLAIMLLGSPILILMGITVYQFFSMRRYDRAYQFTASGITRTLASQPPKAFLWEKISAYRILPLLMLQRTANAILRQPHHMTIELCSKKEYGTLFSDVVMSFDVPIEREQEVIQYLQARGLTRRYPQVTGHIRG